MTVVKYIMASGVCTTAELLALKRNNPKDYQDLRAMAEHEMRHNGIEITEEATTTK